MASDEFPQWLNISTASNATTNNFGQTETKTPVTIGSKLIMEILAIEHQHTSWDVVSDADVTASFTCQLTSATLAAQIALNDSRVIAMGFDEQLILEAFEGTETGGAGAALQPNTRMDKYAEGGKGFLYAGTSIFANINTVASNNIRSYRARILYRMVKVTDTELLGLVAQLQQ